MAVAPKALRKSIVKCWYLLSTLLVLTLVSGCNGFKSEDEDVATVGENAQLTLSLLDINGQLTNSITAGNQLNLQVQLSDTNGNVLEGKQIDFTTTGGQLSASSRLTNSLGRATVSVDSSNVASGVVEVSASVAYKGESLTIADKFEVLAVVTTVSGTPNVSITLKQDGEATNRIRVSESAQLGVQLLDSDNNPIAESVVTFSAELGTLNATTALTNANGLAEVTLTGVAQQLGAALATVSVTVNSSNFIEALAYEVVEEDALDQSTTVLIGYFDNNSNFVEGQLKSEIVDAEGNTAISAGATLGLSVVLVDQNFNRITTPTQIEFSSTCVNSAKASIDAQVSTVNGEARTTYQDISCAGSLGNEDVIVATVKVNSADLTANRTVSLQPEGLGSIEFVSASPESIVLKGTGGQGKQETATLTFLVKGELGNPLNQQNVTFSLNTDVGNLAMASATGVTNAEGLVSVKVISGTVPTAVRVTAQVESGESTIATQSDLLSVNTGLPDQDSLTLALTQINPEARNVITTVDVVAYLADSFNNPVPDGTTVNFTTEGGTIQPSCTTTNGNCSVEWKSTQPYPENHRATILATAEGHEFFVDVNGNNTYDDGDGGAANSELSNNPHVNSGLDRIGPLTSGFVDMEEAWRDDNENGEHDSGELFIDANNNKTQDTANGVFNGPQCSGDNCAETNFVTIRKAAVIIMSGSNPLFRLQENGGNIIYSDYGEATVGISSIARGDIQEYIVDISDIALQTLPEDTSVSVDTSVGEVNGETSFSIGRTIGTSDPNAYGGRRFSFNLKNTLAQDVTIDSDTATVNIKITTDGGLETTLTFNVTLE